MRASNKLVREWLLKNGYDEIWFKAHGKRNDYVFTQRGTYMAQDIWNLFDGICFTAHGAIVFLQMKTNVWANDKKYESFCIRHSCRILSFNVSNKLKECRNILKDGSEGKIPNWKVFVREY